MKVEDIRSIGWLNGVNCIRLTPVLHGHSTAIPLEISKEAFQLVRGDDEKMKQLACDTYNKQLADRVVVIGMPAAVNSSKRISHLLLCYDANTETETVVRTFTASEAEEAKELLSKHQKYGTGAADFFRLVSVGVFSVKS